MIPPQLIIPLGCLVALSSAFPWNNQPYNVNSRVSIEPGCVLIIQSSCVQYRKPTVSLVVDTQASRPTPPAVHSMQFFSRLRTPNLLLYLKSSSASYLRRMLEALPSDSRVLLAATPALSIALDRPFWLILLSTWKAPTSGMQVTLKDLALQASPRTNKLLVRPLQMKGSLLRITSTMVLKISATTLTTWIWVMVLMVMIPDIWLTITAIQLVIIITTTTMTTIMTVPPPTSRTKVGFKVI